MAGSPEDIKKPMPPGPGLLPKAIFGNNTGSPDVLGDSTFILKDLESRFAGHGRSLYPKSPGLAFLALLLEDFCDEWMTKAMFHYRWVHDAEAAAYGIALSRAPSSPKLAGEVAAFAKERQVGRLAVVGSNAATATVIEESFCRILGLLAAHFDSGFQFLLGSRPSVADFALYGQLHPMVHLDVHVSARVFDASPRVWFWVHSMRDLSGLSLQNEDAGWLPQADGAPLPPTLRDLLQELGRMYVPFMLANARAVELGQKEVRVALDNGQAIWEQPSFKYQAKCVRWLREAYEQLMDADRKWLDSQLIGTECLGLLADAGYDVPESRL